MVGVTVLPLTFLLSCPPTTSPNKSRRLLKGPCLLLLLLEMDPCLPRGMKSPQSVCVFRGTPQPYTTNSSVRHLWLVWEFGKFSCSYCPEPGALIGMSLLHVSSFLWALAVLLVAAGHSLPCGQSTSVVLWVLTSQSDLRWCRWWAQQPCEFYLSFLQSAQYHSVSLPGKSNNKLHFNVKTIFF